MPLTIVTPTDDPNTANSYATLAEARAYLATRLPVVADPGDDTLAAWCIAGTRELDASFTWTGEAVDPDNQSLDWFRSGMLNKKGGAVPITTIPTELKNAAVEFGIQLGSGDLLSDNDPLKKGITSVKAGSVALTFSDVQGHNAATAEGAEVQVRKEQSDMRYVGDTVPREVRRLLVPGWYEEAGIQQPLMFGAM